MIKENIIYILLLLSIIFISGCSVLAEIDDNSFSGLFNITNLNINSITVNDCYKFNNSVSSYCSQLLRIDKTNKHAELSPDYIYVSETGGVGLGNEMLFTTQLLYFRNVSGVFFYLDKNNFTYKSSPVCTVANGLCSSGSSYNDSELRGLINNKLNISDQRYNETTLINNLVSNNKPIVYFVQDSASTNIPSSPFNSVTIQVSGELRNDNIIRTPIHILLNIDGTTYEETTIREAGATTINTFNWVIQYVTTDTGLSEQTIEIKAYEDDYSTSVDKLLNINWIIVSYQ